MRRFEVLLRMPGPEGRPGVYGGTVNPPGPCDEVQARAIVARSDAQDARPLADVQAEVARRSGPIVVPDPSDVESPAAMREPAPDALLRQPRRRRGMRGGMRTGMHSGDDPMHRI